MTDTTATSQTQAADERGDATDHTKRTNQAVLNDLPFDYHQDFDDAARRRCYGRRCSW